MLVFGRVYIAWKGMKVFMAGKLFGIGVGPGDPELLTVKAINAIKQLDVIIAPKTEKKDGSVALNIASQYIKPETEIYTALFERYGLKPKECVFFDDREENIEAAGKLGMHGIVFTSKEEAEQKLDELLKDNLKNV